MSAGDWLTVAAGIALVLIGLREVFHTLLHPGGIGTITPWVFRATWRAGQRVGGGARSVAGPLGIIGSATCWTLLLVLGFALVYWPGLPTQFQVADGVPQDRQGSLADALYVSMVALSTLGLGDVVAEETPLRLAMAAEALIGFGLLTASISWVLSIYPALRRRRALAAQLRSLLVGRDEDARLAIGGPPAAQALVLHGLTERLATVRVDLVQYPSTYFFHAPAGDLSLPAILPALRAAVERELPGELAVPARTVREALDGLATTLRDGPFPLDAEDPADLLRQQAADHGR